MARIRTIKPEAFASESLAEVSVEAERTFFGLLTEVDDQGRYRDQANVIYGRLWVNRAGYAPLDVADHLDQLERAELICRYKGCDGKAYLHVVTFKQHQKIDRASASRRPACPTHQADEHCGGCGSKPCVGATASTPTARRTVDDSSPSDPRTVTEGSASPRASQTDALQGGGETPRTSDPATGQCPSAGDETVALGEEDAGQLAFVEPSSSPRGAVVEDSPPGSRILDPGSSPKGAASAPGSKTPVGELMGEYLAACATRPPADVIGHLGRIAKRLLAEGIDREYVRAGLLRFAANPHHPSVLTSMVNQEMNSRTAAGGYRAWTNPTDVSAYAEEL